MDMSLHTSSDKMDWGTPTKFFNGLHRVFKFDIDVCAVPSNAKLPYYWTPDDDALKQDWSGLRCWCNPPFGRSLPVWSDKIHKEAFFAYLIALLVPAATSTKWFRSLTGLGAKFCFLNSKLCFEAPGNVNNAPFHSVLVVLGNTTSEQDLYLQSIGKVMVEL